MRSHLCKAEGMPLVEYLRSLLTNPTTAFKDYDGKERRVGKK